MNVNIASANMAQQYANNLQATAQPVRTPDETVQAAQQIPEEPSREARPVQEVNDSAVGRNVDTYV